jgi:hypothetical protein
MTGERELPEGERSEIGGDDGEEEVIGSGGPESDWSGGAPGVKNPTLRTLGSITVRAARRGSIRAWKGWVLGWQENVEENFPLRWKRFWGVYRKSRGFGLMGRWFYGSGE